MQEQGHLRGLQIGFLWTMCVTGWLEAFIGKHGRTNTPARDFAIEICRFINWGCH